MTTADENDARARIVVERIRSDLWAFEVIAADGKSVDHSLAATMGQCWRMAKRSFKRYADA